MSTPSRYIYIYHYDVNVWDQYRNGVITIKTRVNIFLNSNNGDTGNIPRGNIFHFLSKGLGYHVCYQK